MLDSQQRIQQKIRDENQKRIKDQLDDEKIIRQQKRLEAKKKKQLADGNGPRKFDEFMEDQIIHQTKRYEKLKAATMAEMEKSSHVPQISQKSRKMIEKKAQEEDRPQEVYQRLNTSQPRKLGRESRRSQGNLHESPYKGQKPGAGSPKANSMNKAASQRLFSPAISKRSENIKRAGKVEDELYKDGIERKLKRQQAEIEAIKKEKTETKQLTNQSKVQQNKLLLEKFERDLEEVYQQFEIQDSSEISATTLTEIAILMGFVQNNDNQEMDGVQSIWNHLQPSTGQ